MPDQNYSEPSLVDDTDHELLFKAAYALWLTEQSGGGGAGTVTSVGLSLPASLFTVTGSPVTTSGTLDGALATQTANTVFAGPTTGAAAAPTFRALVAADMVAAGNNTELQYNNSGALGASAALTFGGGTLNIGTAGTAGQLDLASDGAAVDPHIQLANIAGGFAQLAPASGLASGAVTIPLVTGIMVVDSATQTLTNKTISGASNTITNVSLTTGVTGDLPLANLAQASAASRLLGRGSAAGAGDFQEITLGSGLSMASQVLGAAFRQFVVVAPKTDTATGTDTSPATVYSGSITPLSSDSKIIIIVSGAATNTFGEAAFAQIANGTTALQRGDAAGSRERALINLTSHSSNFLVPGFTVVASDAPASVAAQTYNLQLWCQAGSWYLNRSPADTDNNFNLRGATQMFLIEVAP